MLRFDEATHTYTYNGDWMPSVTGVLGEIKDIKLGGRRYKYNTVTGSVVPAEIMDDAADFGNAVHKGAKLILEGVALDWGKMEAGVSTTLKVFEDFLSDYKVEPFDLEKPRCSFVHWVAGTADFWGRLNGELAIIDYKTGAEFPLVGPQTAGYEVNIREETGERGAIKRYSLKLHPKGYTLAPLYGPDDLGFFLAKVYQHKVLTKINPKYNRR